MCYFSDDQYKKDIDPNRIKIDGKSYKNILIYCISYATTSSVKPSHFITNKLNRYIKDSNGNKYVTLVPYSKNKNTLKIMNSQLSIKLDGKLNNSGNYDKKYIKMKFNSGDHYGANILSQ